MSIAVITGSAGLIGSQAARHFAAKGLTIVGIDNDMRGRLFGADASTRWLWKSLEKTLLSYSHVEADIRDSDSINQVFARFGKKISVVIHAAGQPSHDWAGRDPLTDFSINATGTLVLLEATRRYCPDATFVFCSTNKVYGDAPNHLPFVELETRWALPATHAFGVYGIDETMSIDKTMHSLFGVSKSAADLLVQEYGRYFGMRTACFRCGCLTGPDHRGAPMHGFLSYLVKCAVTNQPYTVFGYKGKQVRDNLHASDLVSAFWCFYENPRSGEIYNMGGGRMAHCSVIEAIRMVEVLTARTMNWVYTDKPRAGDHMWWISDVRRFQTHYPSWGVTHEIRDLLAEIHAACVQRSQQGPR